MLDPTEALEVPLKRAIDQAGVKGKPARMAVAVELYDGRRYHRVPGLSWKVNYSTVEDAKALLEALDQVFKRYEAEGGEISLGQGVAAAEADVQEEN